MWGPALFFMVVMAVSASAEVGGAVGVVLSLGSKAVRDSEEVCDGFCSMFVDEASGGVVVDWAVFRCDVVPHRKLCF
jgi:hypothetical protein